MTKVTDLQLGHVGNSDWDTLLVQLNGGRVSMVASLVFVEKMLNS